MLPITSTTIRLTLHVLGVTVWVGGQLTLLGLLPTLRRLGGDTAAVIGRRFNVVAWIAFVVVVVTGLWNLAVVSVADTTTEYQTTLFLKLAFVALSGVGAFLHGRSTSRTGTALWGAVGFLAAVAALVGGIQLTGGS